MLLDLLPWASAGWVSVFLKIPLVGFPCNLVLPVYDVEWVYQEISPSASFQVLIDLQWPSDRGLKIGKD